MKKLIFCCTMFMSLWFSSASGQETYWSSGGELIVGFADFDSAGKKIYGRPRLSFFFHLNALYNLDFGNNVGLATGITARNIGFTQLDEYLVSNEDPTNTPYYEKTKRRSWTAGVPLMLKFGNFKKHKFLFLGAEYNLLFHFKEKRWLNGDKQKRTQWFSDETNRFIPSVFVGFQFSKHYALKFQYYLDDFLNRDYELNTSNGVIRPYAEYTSRLFYISLQRNLRYKSKKKRMEKEEDTQPDITPDDGEQKAFRSMMH